MSRIALIPVLAAAVLIVAGRLTRQNRVAIAGYLVLAFALILVLVAGR